MAAKRVCILAFLLLSLAEGFVVQSGSQLVVAHLQTHEREFIMAGGGQGFNSFRRWPSASSVSLTNNAQSFFGLEGQQDCTLEQMMECSKCDSKALQTMMGSMPLPDQRGESILLDVDGQGRLHWTKHVA